MSKFEMGAGATKSREEKDAEIRAEYESLRKRVEAGEKLTDEESRKWEGMKGVTSIEELKLPESIDGDLDLKGRTSVAGLELPKKKE